MKQPSWWFTPAVILAFVAGVLRSLQPFIPLLLTEMFGPSSELENIVFSVSSIIGALASPVGVFIAGYSWGSREDARSVYRGFSLAVYGGAVIGFVIATLGRFVASFGPIGESPFRQLLFFGVSIFGLLDVPLAALAGGAVGHFRSVESTDGIHTETE